MKKIFGQEKQEILLYEKSRRTYRIKSHPKGKITEMSDKIVIRGVGIDNVTLAEAAEIFKDRKVAKRVRAIIIPATQEVYMQCISEGLTEIFINAGCAVSTPTCGACLGGHMGILAAGEKCLSTTNRNFVGRMGHVESEVYLCSPAVAAASAIAGRIVSPESIEGVE